MKLSKKLRTKWTRLEEMDEEMDLDEILAELEKDELSEGDSEDMYRR